MGCGAGACQRLIRPKGWPYHCCNKDELDAEIERQSQEAEALKPRLINSALRHKLLDVKKPK